jgi:anti-sigma regulatory factor (Ser/Thr protein kinase)
VLNLRAGDAEASLTMPLNLKALPLDPDPESVKAARAWVRSILGRLGRDDVSESAELAVSELVTNAILHGTPPISVRVRGTKDHPRVEVRDASNRPPEVNVDMTDEEHLLATFGRGLGLVALHSSAWGAELAPDGKVVWFEPADEPRLDGELSGEVFDLDQTVQERIAASGLPDSSIPVRFIDLPVKLFARFRQRYYELSRELRLLSLAHGQDYPVARQLADIFLEVEKERRLTRGLEPLERAMSEGAERIDLDLLVPQTSPETSRRLLETLERADEFCREQRLLVLAATPLEKAVQQWWLSEFFRQAVGEDPTPWPGPFTVEEPAPVEGSPQA